MKKNMVAFFQVEIKEEFTDKIVAYTSGTMKTIQEDKFTLENQLQTDLYIEIIETSFYQEEA